MNRRKKVNSILKRRAKKAKKLLTPSTKPKYVSKADREKLASEGSLEEANSELDQSSNTSDE